MWPVLPCWEKSKWEKPITFISIDTKMCNGVLKVKYINIETKYSKINGVGGLCV